MSGGRGRGLTLPAWMTNPGTDTSNGSTSNSSDRADRGSDIPPVTAGSLPVASAGITETTRKPDSIPSSNGISAPTYGHNLQLPPSSLPVGAAPPRPNHIGGNVPVGVIHQHQQQQYRPPQQYPTMNMTLQPSYGLGMPHHMPPHIQQMQQMQQPGGAMGMGRGMPPRFLPPPQMVVPPRGARPPNATPSQIIGDPNNDASCWSEHKSPQGKSYWFNRVTQKSTYEKPFCLKSPEERSIPACPWKEYSAADGKTYYSNGTASKWEMPEEYRVWKEKVEEVQQRKAAAAAALQLANAEAAKAKQEAVDAEAQRAMQHQHQLKSQSQYPVAAGAAGGFGGAGQQQQQQGLLGVGSAAGAPPFPPPQEQQPQIQYASHAEAVEAFKSLLLEKKVSSSAKMREAADACQSDARWDALRSQGEKKQALAEYQTKRLKQEKEAQKFKARRHRDAFLLMLAETTDIDANTRWRDARELLQNDARYKNVEDVEEREDLFRDFIQELEKKEKADRKHARDRALANFRKLLEDNVTQGKVHRKSTWSECKKMFLDVMCKAEYRAMDGTDFRRSFQAYVVDLEEQHASAERKRKQERDEKRKLFEAELAEQLDQLVKEGLVTSTSRWKDLLKVESLMQSSALTSIANTHGGGSEGEKAATAVLRDLFDRLRDSLADQYRADKRLVKDFLFGELKFKVKHDTSFDDMKSAVMKAVHVKEVPEEVPVAPPAYGGAPETTATAAAADAKVRIVAAADEAHDEAHDDAGAATGTSHEEGEDRDGNDGRSSGTGISVGNKLSHLASDVKSLLLQRPVSLLCFIYEDIHGKVLEEYEEEQRYTRKIEGKFTALLQENFHGPEHVHLQWDDAKKVLQRRSVYDALGRTDRRRLFAEHMATLVAKFGGSSISPANDANTDVATTKVAVELVPVSVPVPVVGEEKGSNTTNDLEEGEETEIAGNASTLPVPAAAAAATPHQDVDASTSAEVLPVEENAIADCVKASSEQLNSIGSSEGPAVNGGALTTREEGLSDKATIATTSTAVAAEPTQPSQKKTRQSNKRKKKGDSEEAKDDGNDKAAGGHDNVEAGSAAAIGREEEQIQAEVADTGMRTRKRRKASS